MGDRVLSSAVLICLVAVFGLHGLISLFRACRATDSTTWTEEALQGGLGVIASAFLADVVIRLLV